MPAPRAHVDDARRALGHRAHGAEQRRELEPLARRHPAQRRLGGRRAIDRERGQAGRGNHVRRQRDRIRRGPRQVRRARAEALLFAAPEVVVAEGEEVARPAPAHAPGRRLNVLDAAVEDVLHGEQGAEHAHEGAGGGEGHDAAKTTRRGGRGQSSGRAKRRNPGESPDRPGPALPARVLLEPRGAQPRHPPRPAAPGRERARPGRQEHRPPRAPPRRPGRGGEPDHRRLPGRRQPLHPGGAPGDGRARRGRGRHADHRGRGARRAEGALGAPRLRQLGHHHAPARGRPRGAALRHRARRRRLALAPPHGARGDAAPAARRPHRGPHRSQAARRHHRAAAHRPAARAARALVARLRAARGERPGEVARCCWPG